MLRRYAVANALFAFPRHLQPITHRCLPARCRPAARLAETCSLLSRSSTPRRGAGGIRASLPAGETGMSERAGADLPEARDGEGQLSKDALRSPAPRLIEQDRLAPRKCSGATLSLALSRYNAASGPLTKRQLRRGIDRIVAALCYPGAVPTGPFRGVVPRRKFIR